jgi:hypothetical protein
MAIIAGTDSTTLKSNREAGASHARNSTGGWIAGSHGDPHCLMASTAVDSQLRCYY